MMNDQLRRRSVGSPAARSLLLTLLGEYVLPARAGVWQETLIGALGTMGYKTQVARQALARSVTAGWLETERHGRRSRIRLTPDSAEMPAPVRTATDRAGASRARTASRLTEGGSRGCGSGRSRSA